MKESRSLKRVLAILLIVTILLPYTEVFAGLTHKDTTAMLETSIVHEGGEDSGLIPEEHWDNYDVEPYSYQIANSGDTGRTTVFKIIREGDVDFEDALYCLNAQKSFPSASAKEYKNIGDLKNETETAASTLINSIGAKNYKSLVWIIDNMYLRKQQPGEKLDFIKKAFATEIADGATAIPPVTAEYIASIVTDDDIEVVQQWAIWYFTNGNKDGYAPEYEKYYHAKYSTFGTVYVSGRKTSGYTTLTDLTGNGARQDLLNKLYGYFVNSAKVAASAEKVTYPTFAMQNSDLICTVEGDNYKVGPFKINGGTGTAVIKLVDNEDKLIDRSKYQIKIEGEDSFTDKNVDQIFDKNYYIYLPIEGNTIAKLKITLDYSTYETEASLWSVQSDSSYQPVTLITRGTKPYSDSRERDVDNKKFDLALRKYIIKNATTEVKDRIPEVDPSVIASEGTAKYAHKKNAVKVEPGKTVVYEIRVFNEGTLNGAATEITDYLPEGMTLATGSSINDTYKWSASDDGRVVKTDYLKDHELEAYSGTGDLDSAYVQIECKIADDLAEKITENTILTNVAEITGYSRKDSDSEPSIDPSTIDTKNFSGHKDNKEDLSDSTYHYKGLQDDDDFEKVVVEPNKDIFDLALRKFITKINGKAPATSREPKVDASKLKAGTSTNATYTHPKNALTVSKGDIVTYKIRVYNEGDISGYAEEVADYLPTGLGYLMNYKANIENKWAIPEGAKQIKLSEVENAKNNLKKDDFSGDLKLEDQIVVVGGGKFVSTALSSKNSSNLIKAFDKAKANVPDYKDIEITCVVLTDVTENNNLKNIAEIKADLDENKNEVEDRDSKPDTVNPNDYPGGDKDQDDHDYENLINVKDKKFDLALQKFITGLNGNKVDGREPTITKNNDGTFRYNHTTEPLLVANSDLVTYTIRVYNEGEVDGYAKEVMDDIPTGLKFLPDNATNKEYGWKMYDKNGKETSDVNQAASVKTSYLSKDNEKDGRKNLIEAYNSDTMKTPLYKDVKVVFQVVETALPNKSERVIINTAEISDDEDKDGNEVEDRDSTPGNNKDGEDDIDKERIKLKFFDLALEKYLTKIIIIENGKTREIVAKNKTDLLKVEVNRKYLNSTTVKFVYDVVVTNQGEIAGYAKELKDHIPDGLKFVAEDNSNWTAISDKVVKTEALANTLLEPGQSASVSITLQWINGESNLGQKINIAEISKDYNEHGSPDIDSTPDNFVPEEDDQDDAPVILSISTGEQPVYIVLSTTVMLILATGISLIKKYVLI